MENEETLTTVRKLTEQLGSGLRALESEGMKSVMQISQVHGFPYQGPTVNMPDIRAAIEAGQALLQDDGGDAPGETNR